MKTVNRLLSPPRLSFVRFKSTETTNHTPCWSDIVKSNPSLENTFLSRCLTGPVTSELKNSIFTYKAKNNSGGNAIGSRATFQTRRSVAPVKKARTSASTGLLKPRKIRTTPRKSQSLGENRFGRKDKGLFRQLDDDLLKTALVKTPPPAVPARKVQARNYAKQTIDDPASLYKKLQESYVEASSSQTRVNDEGADTLSKKSSFSKYVELRKKKPDVSILDTKSGIPSSPVNVFKNDRAAKSTFFEEIQKRQQAKLNKKNSQEYLIDAARSGSSSRSVQKFTPRTSVKMRNNQHLSISHSGKEKTKLPAGFQQIMEAAKGNPKVKKNPLKDMVANYLDRLSSSSTGKSNANLTSKTVQPSNPDVQSIRKKMKRNVSSLAVQKSESLQPQIYPRGSLSTRTSHLPIEPCRRMQTAGAGDDGGGNRRGGRDGPPRPPSSSSALDRTEPHSMTANVINRVKAIFSSFFRER